MKKHAKGALAAGTAAVLLLGGAGTLAYWSDSASASGTDITSGSLGLDSVSATGWVYAQGNANAGQEVKTIVPGDTIAQQHIFTVKATGDNIKAHLNAPATVDATVTGSDGEPTAVELPVSVNYTLSDQSTSGALNDALITNAQNGKQLVATVTVDFPFGDETINANDTQNVTAALDDLTVTLEQVENTGA